MNATDIAAFAGLVAIGAPLSAAAVLTATGVLGLGSSERTVQRVVSTAFLLALAAVIVVDALVLGGHAGTVTLTRWISVAGYDVDARLTFDVPAAVLMSLTAALCSLVGAFSAPYLHAEPGFRRFFVLLSLFAGGMMAIASGGTLDVLLVGWETVGLTSALLIAYFGTRDAPARHGLRAFATYRTCDVWLIVATVILHREAGEATFDAPHAAAAVGWMLLLGAMGKSASLPFTGWLPRAMEGPTPSSAIFYGALSIHAGPFLLLRARPLYEGQPMVCAAIGAVGIATALHASGVGRVQTDVKSRAAYAAAAQVGLIFVEIAAGFTSLALVHTAGHAVLRTWQLLRAPSLLHEHHQLAAMLGDAPPPTGRHIERVAPSGVRRMAYSASLARWYLDDLGGALVRASGSVLRRVDRLDATLSDALENRR